MEVLAFYHIKGGVGKTAAAVNIAYLASRDGWKTLFVDLDPQGSASFYFRIRPRKKVTAKKLLAGGPRLERLIRGTDFEGLDLLPADIGLRRLDIALSAERKPDKRIRSVLRGFAEEYELVILDCPPNITLLSGSVFHAARWILVPVVPTTLSVVTYRRLLRFFEDHGLPEERIRAFFSMVERRKRLHRELSAELAAGDERFLRAAIPYASDVEKMGLHREPVECFSPRSRAAAAYRALWGEIRARLAPERPDSASDS